MTNQEAQATIRQMLKDWDGATPEQRAECLAIAADKAAKATRGPSRCTCDNVEAHDRCGTFS